MKKIWVISFIITIILLVHTNALSTSVEQKNSALLKFRASHHKEFLRIVFEGSGSVIGSAEVSQQDSKVIISFKGNQIGVDTNRKLPFKYTVEKESIIVSLQKSGNLNIFTLKDPSRLVIDVSTQENETKDASEKQKIKESFKKTVVMKHEQESTDKQVKNAQAANDAMVNNNNKNAEREKTIHSSTLRSDENLNDEIISIPERYLKLWTLYKKGNTFAVLALLPEYEPKGVEELAAYHYLYGEAYIVAEQFVKAVEHLRLAYIYATDNILKEKSLFRRAEIYESMGLIYEARSNYSVFIQDYPSSKRLKKAHLGLANSLSLIGAFSDAVEHYKQAGDSPVVLYKKANALQRLERIKEAREVYDRALLADRYYPEKSFETYYLIGENLRLLGRSKEARQHLSGIYYGPYYNSALISLGLIEMDDANVNLAIKYFKKASRSTDRQVRARALFSLSFAYLSKDDKQGAIESLKEFRRKHIDSVLYKDALIALSKIYKEEGKIEKAIPLLKELIYGKKPPIEAFKELEEIVLKSGKRSNEESYNDISFLDLWREVKLWLIDESRPEFLLKVAERLRHEGDPFIEVSSWLIEHGTQHVRSSAAIMLADYYIGIGEIALSETNLLYAIGPEKPSDDFHRVKGKIFRAKGEYIPAIEQFRKITKINKSDLARIGAIIIDMKPSDNQIRETAIALYEERLNESAWDAEDYIRLADIYKANNENEKANKYYEVAYKKNPDDEWTMYMMGNGMVRGITREIYGRLGKGDNMLGRLAKTRLMEWDLMNKVREVY